jgi:DNA-binding transcriptional regulator GbsR (MarR family)
MARAVESDNAPEERRHGAPREAEHRFSDELGFFWEDAGGTRMAGRVLGALLLADPPELSSSELSEFLGVSPGSVSTATRELIRPGLAQRVRIPGKRQDYFRATMGASVLPQIIRTRIELTRRYGQLMQRGEELAADKDPAVRRQLGEIREFYEFIEAEQLAILDRWEQRQRERTST